MPIDLQQDSLPAGPLKIAALEGCREFAGMVDQHLVQMRKTSPLSHLQNFPLKGYFEDSYLKQYKGLEELNATSVKDDGQIKFISGASVSGSAVHYGVYAALAQYKAMGGVQ